MEYAPVHLLPWQTLVWDDTHRFKVINCGRRTGKSTLSLLKMVDFATNTPNMRVWYVAPTYRQAKNIMWEMLKDMIPDAAVVQMNESELVCRIQGGSVIELKGADNPDSLRGVKIDLIIFDEVAFISGWAMVWTILRPTLMDSQAECWFISTPNGFNHFKVLADTCHKRKDWQYFHYTIFDNPHISRDEIEQAKTEMTEDAFAQEMLGDFRKIKGLVYKNFDPDIHVKELTDFEPVFWLRGLDRGFTNPTAVCYVQVDKDDTWYVVDELYQTGLTTARLSPILFDKDEELGIEEYELSTMDSAQASDIKELQDYGHDFLPVKKESGETKQEYVRYKISRLYERFNLTDGKPKIYIHPRCANLIREFSKYSYKEKRVIEEQRGDIDTIEKYNEEENPQKENDHMPDALGDLNVMYQHFYHAPKDSNPWDGKLEGTFIPPSPTKEEHDDIWETQSSVEW